MISPFCDDGTPVRVTGHPSSFVRGFEACGGRAQYIPPTNCGHPCSPGRTTVTVVSTSSTSPLTWMRVTTSRRTRRAFDLSQQQPTDQMTPVATLLSCIEVEVHVRCALKEQCTCSDGTARHGTAREALRSSYCAHLTEWLSPSAPRGLCRCVGIYLHCRFIYLSVER